MPTFTIQQFLIRLRKRTRIDPATNCWIFLGRLTTPQRVGTGREDKGGYGVIKFQGKVRLLHRVAAHIFLGLNLEDVKEQANHKKICTSRACWNPDHLYKGNQHHNVKDFHARS